jgi:hypothetical protein
MATVNKNFRIKHGLIVEGTSGTINGENILTEGSGDQYIINLIGGSATAENTPSTVVLRDGSGNFAAGTVTVNQLNIGSIGNIHDDGDLIIANTDGNDVILEGEDIRLNAADDVRLNAGVGGNVSINATSGQINLSSANVYVGDNIDNLDSERVASQGYVDDAIANIDLSYTTDDVTEGSNLYFTDSRAVDAVADVLGTGIVFSSETAGNVFHIDETYLGTEITDGARAAVGVEFGGTPLTYNSSNGIFGINLAADNSVGLDGSNGLKVNRDTVDEWYDESGAAAAAQTAAQGYADGLASNYDPAGSASAAQTAAQGYADGLASNYDAAGSASAAQTAAQGYTDSALEDYTPTSSLDTTVDGYGYLKSADLSGYATESYVGTAIDNLVDGAPGLLDTLNEIAAAIADDENYATTMTTALAGKQNNLTAGSNIDIIGDTISVTGLDAADISDFNSAALSATSAAYDAAGSASSAQTSAESYASGLVDDVLDGSSAFSEVNVNDLVSQRAAQGLVATAQEGSSMMSWAKSDYGTAKAWVKFATATHSQISEVLLTTDSTGNISITEFGMVGTNGSLGSVGASYLAGNIAIEVDTVHANTTVTVVATLIK